MNFRKRRSRRGGAVFVTSAAIAASLAAGSTAGACDLCAIYTGSLMQQEKTGLVLGIGEQYTHFSDIHEGEDKVPNPAGEWLDSSITQLVAGWSFTPWLGAQMNLPLIDRQWKRLEGGVPERGETRGLGDMSLLLRAAPLSRAFGDWLLHIELLAGLKLPTGDTQMLGEETMEEETSAGAGSALAVGAPAPGGARHEGHEHASAIHGHDLALGSGSVDGIFGVTMHASWKRLFGETALQYVVRGEGDYDYEFADDFQWEVAAGAYLALEHEWTLAAKLVTSGEDKGKDHQDGMVEDATGITSVYVGPGADFTWSDSLHLDLVCDIPVLQDVTGQQIVPDYRLRGGLVWRF